MLNVSTCQHRDGVCLQVVRSRGGRSRVYETLTVVLTPEAARMVGVGLIEDAAAADCYRKEVGDESLGDGERTGR